MTRRSLSPLRNRSLATVALLVGIAVVLAASPANAGFGDLVKKAKDKATKKAEPEAEDEKGAPEDVVFDSVVLELTEARLAKIIAACKKDAATAAANAAKREELVAKIAKIEEARAKITDKDGEKIQELQRKRGDIEVCRHDGYQEAQERRTKEYTDKAMTMDPALIAKLQAVAAQNNAAAARGDTTAINRANAEMMTLMLPTRADSLEVQKKCGPMPPPLPSETALAKLDQDLAAANEELRAFDKKVAATQAETSGMNPEQTAVALERIRNYQIWRGSKKRDHMRGFSDEEVKALEDHIAEIKGC